MAKTTSKSEQALRAFHEEDDVRKSYDLRLLSRLWPFVRPNAGRLVMSMVLAVVLAALSLARPLVMRRGFDAAASGGPAASRAFLIAGILLMGLVVAEQSVAFIQVFALQVVGARAMGRLREHVFGFLHSRRLGFFDKQPVGRLVTRVTSDVDAIGEAFASGALNAVGDLIKLVGIVVLMLALNPKLALIAFAALPPVGLLVNWIRTRARMAYREIRAKTARLNAFVGEQVSGMSVTQAYARERAAQAEFDVINTAYRVANVRAISLESTLDASVEMVASVCIAAVIAYADVRPFGEEISFGTLVAFIAYLEQFFRPISDLSSRYTQLQSAMTGAERVFLLLDNEEPDAPPFEGTAMGDSALAFSFENVDFGYKPGAPVLRGLTLFARPGERIALVGPTGSGKTTVASLLLRLYEPQGGVVRVFGRDVMSTPREELRRQFAVVPQDAFLFPGTIASSVAAGEPKPDLDRVRRALDAIDARELFERREGGLAARVDERGSNLSAGERQLLAFARAIYRDAPVLVLDEATASVDSDTEARLQHALERLLAHRTALVIAHRLSTVRSADRIVVMQKGEIVEQGSHEQLLALGGLYAKLTSLQLAQEAAPLPLVVAPAAALETLVSPPQSPLC